MENKKRARVEAAGYWVGDAADFLGLTELERKLVDFHVQLSIGIRETRERAGLTQAALAQRMDSTQPVVARLESGGRGVSLEKRLLAFLAAGGDLSELPSLGRPNKPTKTLKRSAVKK